jgi:hypothetical protein
MSHEALDWMAALGPHLRGAPQKVLWAAANRANGPAGNLVTMGGRRWAKEADVDRNYLTETILPALVSVGVLKVAKEKAGRYPAHYTFTLCDPSTLPERLSYEPEPEPFSEESHAGVKAARAALNHKDGGGDPAPVEESESATREPGDGGPVEESDSATREPGDGPASGGLSGPSGGLSGSQWRSQTPPKPLNQEPSPSGEGVPGGESERSRRPRPKAGGAREGPTTEPAPPPRRRRRGGGRPPAADPDAQAVIARMLTGEIPRDQAVIDAVMRGEPLPAREAAG